MYIEDPIEMRETSKGYRIQLCYSSHTYEIYDLLEEYVNFCFIDRDIKHVNTINYWESRIWWGRYKNFRRRSKKHNWQVLDFPYKYIWTLRL